MYSYDANCGFNLCTIWKLGRSTLLSLEVAINLVNIPLFHVFILGLSIATS